MKATLEAKHLPRHEYDIVFVGVYYDGSPAFRINCWGDHILTLTVNMAPNHAPNDGCVFIKDWSENEGILDAVLDAGLVEITGRTELAGFEVAHECKLLTLAGLVKQQRMI